MKNNSNLIKIISNYGAKLWGLFSVFIFIPYYIKYLGIEAYAVVGFYALILGVISFADAGLSSAITREFAFTNTLNYKYSIFRLIEKRYQLICLSIAVLLFFLAPLIAERWLKSDTIAISDLTNYIRLIGVGVTIQLLSSLYFGALFGINAQVQANSIQFIWSILKSAVVILVLVFVKNDLFTFFIWQIICNALYVFTLRFLLLNKLTDNNKNVLEIIESKIPKATVQYIAGMSLVAIISSINIQADKVLISSTFSLKIYAYYSIASVLGQLPLILATPLAMTVFPIFSKYASDGVFESKLYSVFKKTTFLSNVIILSTTVILILYTKEILLLWTKDSISTEVLPQIVLVVKFLAVGTAFLAMQLILYYVLLAFGKTRYTIYQGIFQISLGVPLLYLFIKNFGLIGATVPWVLINLGSLLFLFYVCLNNYVIYNKVRYVIYLVLIPLVIITSVSVFFYYLYSLFVFSFIPFAMLSVLFSVLINIMVFNFIEKHALFSIKSLVNFED